MGLSERQMVMGAAESGTPVSMLMPVSGGVGVGISKLGEAVLLVLLEQPGQEGSMLYKSQNHS